LYSADAWFPVGLGEWLKKFAESWRPTVAVVAYPFLSKAFEYLPSKVVKVIDAQDVFTARNDRIGMSGIKTDWLSLTESQEGRLLKRADSIIAIQPEEADYFKTIVGPKRVATASVLMAPVNISKPSEARPNIGLIGSSNEVNLAGAMWFLDNVFPQIREQLPGARLIVGGSLAEHLAARPGLELFGGVADRRAFYSKCRIMVNPSSAGTGIKIKSLEALTYGRPLVTTPHGATGVTEAADHGLLIRESAKDFATAVLGFLLKSDVADIFGRAGWEFIAKQREYGLEALKLALHI
jgi:glycosyltransferase involved in cell wall biosynthesis